MCTAISLSGNHHYFGRNLDFEHGYGECVTITPREYPFHFSHLPTLEKHYAMIGMAAVENNYPLYFDATNEHGLSMAGLYFPVSACYETPQPGKENLATYELIPWILGTCKTVGQAVQKLENINVIPKEFHATYPTAPLHWLLADHSRAITVEPVKNGLQIYENKMGVLTNEPPFDYHITNLNNYLNLTSREVRSRFSPELSLEAYSRGMGAIGLPGDLSSSSRFIKAAFTKLNAVRPQEENSQLSQVFHILETVSQTEGCIQVGDKYEKTLYTSCCDTSEGIYYYTTYENRQITGVRLQGAKLDTAMLQCYPLHRTQHLQMDN